MSVQTVNGHVLLPHLPDWRTMVSFQRQWQTAVGRSLAGGEGRVAPRIRPRLRLGWSLFPVDVSDQARMHARLRAARKSGYACAPYWGRGIRISQAAGDTISLASDAWTFLEEGDALLIRRLDVTTPEAFEVVTVLAIISAVELDLPSAL